MNHLFIHACAGSGKTQHIIDRCAQGKIDARRLILTLTLAGQDEIESRLQSCAARFTSFPEVKGWYAFLLHHVVRPYLPLAFPKQRLNGFIFDAGEARQSIRRLKKSNPRRYFTADGLVYKDHLEELAALLLAKADGLVESRLSQIYDEILIDEAQDISRSGLDIIGGLLEQEKVRCLIVGDVRQSLLDSNLSSTRNKGADRQNLIQWYRGFEKRGLLRIEEKSETYRFNQAIADFSDTIFPESLGLAPTVSLMRETAVHNGVFLVSKQDLESYYSAFQPTVLRYSKSSWKDQNALEPINFGVSKGRTYEHVMILATKSIQEFCLKKGYLKGKSACSFYVAVTRAKYSVAIVVDQPRRKLSSSAPAPLRVWTPKEH